MGRNLRGWLAALGLLGCLTAQAQGPVWAVRGASNTVYLAGSVHALREATLPEAFERAYRESEVLIMEIDLDDLDEQAAQRWILEHGTFGDGRTLRQAIGEARHRRVSEAAARLGMPVEGLEPFEPWTVALTLTQLELSRLGLEPDHGVEKQLERRARADGKRIEGLETIEEQLGALDGLSDADQVRFLELTVEEAAEMPAELDRLLAAWRAGDSKRLEALLLEEYAAFPSLYRPLVSERNRRWIPKLRALLHEKEDYLVIVGALHLVGPDGVIALLERAGVRSRPLETKH